MDGEQSFSEQFENILSSLNNFRLHVNTIQQQIKILEKNVKREFKSLKKDADKNKIAKGNKKPSGFAIPTKVTNELCAFMNQKDGTDIARTDVTKAVIEYINKNKLQNSENKQIIIPDEKLKTLLGINGDEKVTYFTLQKFMNRHFIKPTLKEKEKEIEIEKEE